MSSIQARADYTAKDYDGLKAAMLDYAAQVFPEWKSRSEGDFGVALVELLAYEGDVLSYYGDRIQDESFISTATQRQSLLQIAAMLGYTPTNGVAAVGTVTLQSQNPGAAVVVPAGTVLNTEYVQEFDGPLTFETASEVTVPANGGTVGVLVEHGVTRRDVYLGGSTGLPNQRFRLPEKGVLSDTVRVFVDVSSDSTGTTTQEWSQIGFLVDGDPDSTVFSVVVDSHGETSIQFGDGLNGAFPNNGLGVSTTYRVGGGSVGNLEAGRVVSIDGEGLSGNVFVAVDAGGVALSTATGGGADPESNDQIRANAPRAFRSQNRLVTLTDYADEALTVPGVLRANATAGTFSSVSVYVVGPAGNAPTTALIDSVQAALEPKALAGTTVTVGSPGFVSVNVGSAGSPLVVNAYANVRRSAVKAAVDKAVRTMLSFAYVDFAESLTVSDFYSTIMSVPGVQWVSIPLIARSDAVQTGTADIVCRAWEIPVLGNYSLNVIGGIA